MCHQSVGLVQGAIEAAGIPTVSATVRPEITCGVGVPRAGYVRFPTGAVLGQPGNPDEHRAVLRSLLMLIQDLEGPAIVELPYRWRRWR